jgi:hypothetical protein
MAKGTAKPIIFISYSHKDEPERTPEGDIHWLTEIQSYLAPAVNGTFELWTDEDIAGGTDWEKDIKGKLAVCAICILFVSRHSLASKFVIDVEIATILERRRHGHDVQIYPIVLSPFPEAAAPPSLLALNLRPRLDRPLSGFSRHQRGVEISKIADEIVGLLSKKTPTDVRLTARSKPPGYVHINGLPETSYERLVGRDDELRRLDAAWGDTKTNIISLIAEGGAGKSALVNEWLKRLQVDNYRGADVVLGWSFYSQGTKERATSADEFLSWGLDKLDIKLESTSTTTKGEAIAEAMTQRRVLLILDGVEPLQHGLDTQLGQLKDQGLRAVLRRLAATPPQKVHGLIVLTSRLAIKDIARWQDSVAPIVDVGRLSDEAGAALLRDNGAWGTDKELNATARDFGGHPLALELLASFLKETQFGDVRRRDRIRGYLADQENSRHDHAKRVMESYEKEWLDRQPVLLTIMYLIGLFDRPASRRSIRALRNLPVIEGLTNTIVRLDDKQWQRAISRLREGRLLSPKDSTAPDVLDAHPLVREWFGQRLREVNFDAWRTAHERLFDHLRGATKEGKTPTLQSLAPLYQAISHGCRAERYKDTLEEIYVGRICRGNEYYASQKLGALGSNLAAISWFFDEPYEKPSTKVEVAASPWLLSQAAFGLRAQGRISEALSAQRARVLLLTRDSDARIAATAMLNLSDMELISGEIETAVKTAQKGISYAESVDPQILVNVSTVKAGALYDSGDSNSAKALFSQCESVQKRLTPNNPTLFSLQGFRYCKLFIAEQNWTAAIDRAETASKFIEDEDGYPLLSMALDTLTIGRAHLGLALQGLRRADLPKITCRIAHENLEEAIRQLYAANTMQWVPDGLLARAVLARSFGDWAGAARDLNEVEEIAEQGPMPLFLCDMALERARLAFAKIEAFAPLNRMLEKDNPSKPAEPSAEEVAQLKCETEKQIKIAADYIETCGYHRRDEELTELQAVLRGEKKFAELPPRV